MSHNTAHGDWCLQGGNAGICDSLFLEQVAINTGRVQGGVAFEHACACAVVTRYGGESIWKLTAL